MQIMRGSRVMSFGVGLLSIIIELVLLFWVLAALLEGVPRNVFKLSPYVDSVTIIQECISTGDEGMGSCIIHTLYCTKCRGNTVFSQSVE